MSTYSVAAQTEKPESFAAEVFAGDSGAARRLRLQVGRIAPYFRVALISGERGVGKAAVAREMHRLCPAFRAPFVEFEVARFAEARSVAELFREGSVPKREESGNVGLEQGTLYLTGLDGLRLGAQASLISRLETLDRQARMHNREFRVLLAAACDLRGMVAAGRMLPELHARIGVLEIRVVPLRDRMEDIEMMLRSMLQRLGADYESVSANSLAGMREYGWAGNLAELWHEATHLAENGPSSRVFDKGPLSRNFDTGAPLLRLDEVMQRHVMDMLQRCAGNKLRTAELLGISRSTLYRMLDSSSI